MDMVEVTVRVETVEPLEERLTVMGFNEPVRPFGVVAERDTVPEKLLRLVSFIDDVADEPAAMVSEPGFALSEKSGPAAAAGCMASPINIQPAVALSPNPTVKLVRTVLTVSYSAAIAAPGLEVMMVNPFPGVNGDMTP
jgi:hypothetical protein